MIDLLQGKPLDLERQRDRDDRAASALALDFGYELIEAPVTALRRPDGMVLAAYHPFERTSGLSMSSRASQMVTQHPGAHVTNTFELLRRPGDVVGAFMSK
jgi:hypothetical protein